MLFFSLSQNINKEQRWKTTKNSFSRGRQRHFPTSLFEPPSEIGEVPVIIIPAYQGYGDLLNNCQSLEELYERWRLSKPAKKFLETFLVHNVENDTLEKIEALINDFLSKLCRKEIGIENSCCRDLYYNKQYYESVIDNFCQQKMEKILILERIKIQLDYLYLVLSRPTPTF